MTKLNVEISTHRMAKKDIFTMLIFRRLVEYLMEQVAKIPWKTEGEYLAIKQAAERLCLTLDNHIPYKFGDNIEISLTGKMQEKKQDERRPKNPFTRWD